MLGNGVMEQKHGCCPEAGHAREGHITLSSQILEVSGDGLSKEMEAVMIV